MRALSAVVTLAIGSLAVSSSTPLRVLRVTPSDRAAATAVVSVTFDRPVAGSLDASVDPKRIFTIAPAVVGRVEWRDPITLRFTPAAPLDPATQYTVTVSNEFAAMDGSRLEQPYSFTFRVHGTVALTGAPAGPDDVARFLKPDAQFEVVWSNPVDLGDVSKRVYLQFEPACPVLGVDAVGLSRFARRTQGRSTVERGKLNPPFPQSILSRLAARLSNVAGSDEVTLARASSRGYGCQRKKLPPRLPRSRATW